MRIRTKRQLFVTTVLMVALCVAFSATAFAKVDKRKKVHSIYWKARLKTDVSFQDDYEEIELEKGDEVLVVSRPNTGTPCLCEVDGTRFRIAYKSLEFITDACTIGDGDYSVAVKEDFVNERYHLTSKTNYLIWTSLDKQRVNVFKGSGKGGDWELIRVIKCSSGMATHPTRVHFNMEVDFKERVYRYSSSVINTVTEYYVEFSGSGFHKWVGGGYSKNIGKHPASHSCIRLPTSDAIWMFNTIPLHTRVVNY